MRALRDAKMTADATLVEAFERNGSRRRDRVFAFEGRLSVIRRFVERGRLDGFGRRVGGDGFRRLRGFVAEDGAGDGDRRRGDAERDKVAFASVEGGDFAANAFGFARRKERVERSGVRLRGVLRSVDVVRGDLRFAVRGERKRALAANGQAVETNDATRRVDLKILNVDTGAFTGFRAEAATDAFVGVKADFKERKFRKRAQNRSNRANGIAVKTTVTTGENEQNREGDEAEAERRPAFRRRGNVNEGVAPLRVGDRRENVVSDKVKRFQNRNGDSTENPVRLKEREEGEAEGKRREGEKEETGSAFKRIRDRNVVAADFARFLPERFEKTTEKR